MKNIGIIGSLIFASFIVSCSNTTTENKASNQKDVVNSNQQQETSYTPEVSVLKYEPLLEQFNKNNDTLYVVNFWATWCIPCVKELPHFVKVAQSFSDKPVQLMLVNLDKNSELTNQVIPFITKKQWKAHHFLLDDNGRMNEWISAIDVDWDGAIPATALYKNGKKLRFNSGQLSEEELRLAIQNNL